ncbi:MAG: amino acid permease [archaeon]
MAELQRVLNFPSILLITINSIMGTGIYFLVANGAKYAGPASIISWIAFSVVAIYISACFGELAGMFPKAGGVYEYAKQTYGRFFSFIIGWLAFITGNVTIAMLIVGAIQYLLPFPASLLKVGICLLFLVIFNYMAYRGMKTSAAMLIAFGVISLTVMISVIFMGGLNIDPANFRPLFIAGPFSVVIAIFFIMETFFGWESAVNLSEEVNNPEKVMPKALLYGTTIIAVLALSLAITAIGSVGWKTLAGSSAPLVDIVTSFVGERGRQFITLATYLAIIGSVAGWVVSAPRLILALTRDKLFLSHFEKIHPKYNTPHRAIIFQAIVSAVLVIIGMGSYNALLTLLVPMALMMYAIVLFSIVIQRFRNPDTPRPFKVWFGKVGPLFVVGIFAYLLYLWLAHEPGAWNILNLGFSFIGLGIPLYFLIEIYYDPKMITEVNDITAYLSLLIEDFSLPRKVRKTILNILGDLDGQTVLEYGCSVGTLTQLLSEKVGPQGKVYAVDLSKNGLRITQKRVERQLWASDKRIHGRVLIVHDELQAIRVHDSIEYTDAVVSVGMLSYIQDIQKVLRELYRILPNEGRVCFVEYVDFFKVIPNVEWLGNNEKIEMYFREAGFSVRVIRKKGLFWNYVYVYGIKSEHDVPFI